MKLENKVCIVMGASLGIDKAIALAFTEDGSVVTVDPRSHLDEAKAVVNRWRALRQGGLWACWCALWPWSLRHHCQQHRS